MFSTKPAYKKQISSKISNLSSSSNGNKTIKTAVV
jgi:hypothetical protein